MAVIGIDLGGTKITGAIFDGNAEMLCKATHLLESRKGGKVGELVMKTVDELVAVTGGRMSYIEAVGICVPGIADSKTGLVWAPNIEGWEDYPLQKELEEHTGTSVGMASDRTAYILGETWKGAAKNARNAVFIAVGTGIGVGLLVDGRIVHGRGDIAGAAGWFALETSGLDEYERYGNLESRASGEGMARQARKMLKDGLLFRESSLYSQKTETLTARNLFEAYDRGDPLAEFIIDGAVKMWGLTAANIVSLLNPEIIVWGGGVFGPASRFLDRIYEEACRWAQPIAIKQVEFRESQLGGDAGLYGAGYLALLLSKQPKTPPHCEQIRQPDFL